MKHVKFLVGPLFILVYISNFVKPVDKRSSNQKSCILANSNWDSIYSRNNMILDPYTCNSISDDCCHFYMNYTFNYFPIEKSYCFIMTGKPESWMRKFKNIYQDEQMWYSNNFDDKYNTYQNIGNSLEYIYYENYTCLETYPDTDFSSYNYTNCAIFNSDGSCKIVNDYLNFHIFMKNLYKETSSQACTAYDELGKCKDFQTDPKSNNTALSPLLEILKKDYFHSLDNTNINDTIPNNSLQESYNKWPSPCRNISSIKIKITCSPAYSDGSVIIFSLYKIILCLILCILL